MNVIINNTGKHALPAYETAGAAGLDLRANINQAIELLPMQRALIPTGLFMQLPIGTEGQIRPRSGLAYKHGITVLNAPGTIDADYRGEVMVLLINLSDKTFTINDGDRIAQLVVAPHHTIQWQTNQTLNQTNRGTGGFGHTGQ
ncbi:MAG: dUTP diphosphatase [Bacteroidia bacterium]|nr:dUTP diphosphatase [Bacteroidia bacterium]HQV01354.1 dUTP diphosphatase [Bacteroidia bacterium]